MPIQLGFFILQYAKLILLRMYYDFFKKFCSPNTFKLMHTDTDSLYLCISSENLIDIIKPDKLVDFYKAVYDSCDDNINIEPGVNNYFLTRDCCDKHRKYDQYQPGLFKIEYREGKESIGLSSKSYILIKGKKYETTDMNVLDIYRQYLTNKARKIKSRSVLKRIKINRLKPERRSIKWDFKLVSKGVSKRALKNPVYIYRNVINSQVKQSGCIKGFRLWDGNIYSYVQNKDVFSYFYIKRTVREDGVSTDPISMVLTPVKKNLNYFYDEQEDENLISE